MDASPYFRSILFSQASRVEQNSLMAVAPQQSSAWLPIYAQATRKVHLNSFQFSQFIAILQHLFWKIVSLRFYHEASER